MPLPDNCFKPCDNCSARGSLRYFLFWKTPCPFCGGKGFSLTEEGARQIVIELAEEYKAKRLDKINPTTKIPPYSSCIRKGCSKCADRSRS